MKNKNQMASAGQDVDSAHSALVTARSQTKRCRTMFLNAKTAENEAEANFRIAKENAEQKLIEKN